MPARRGRCSPVATLAAALLLVLAARASAQNVTPVVLR
jgi:hypothetical protein